MCISHTLFLFTDLSASSNISSSLLSLLSPFSVVGFSSLFLFRSALRSPEPDRERDFDRDFLSRGDLERDRLSLDLDRDLERDRLLSRDFDRDLERDRLSRDLDRDLERDRLLSRDLDRDRDLFLRIEKMKEINFNMHNKR